MSRTVQRSSVDMTGVKYESGPMPRMRDNRKRGPFADMCDFMRKMPPGTWFAIPGTAEDPDFARRAADTARAIVRRHKLTGFACGLRDADGAVIVRRTGELKIEPAGKAKVTPIRGGAQ